MKNTAFADSLRLLGTRRFGTFWFASLLSNIGTWAQQVAQPWLLLSIGASSFLVGVDAFALGAPVWLLTLVGGVLADRADRRRVITGFQSLQMLCPAAIVLLLLFGHVTAAIVITLSLVVGITDALSMPSFQSIVPSIVEHEQIPTGLALNSTQFNLSRILGPALAGVLIAGIGVVGCFALSAASYIPFIAVALWILPRRSTSHSEAMPFDRHHPFAGIPEVLRERNLRGALATVLATGLMCGPLITFVPVIVRDVLHGDASHFSAAVGAFGIGGLVGAGLFLAATPGRDLRRISNHAAMLYGAVLIGVALNPWFWGLTGLLVAAGLSMNMSNTAANSFLQSAATPQLRGRTVSLFMLASRGGVSVGSLLTGAMVHWLGAGPALLVNGLLALAVQAAIGHFWLRAAPPLPAQNPG
ncbi:MAG TPA: MFS transporter [Burkholderiales bacterium]|nr:MFS transporter [Burkholderiales bacterium]